MDGGSSIDFAKWCNGNYEKIYAFEPTERMIPVIEQNFKANGIENSEIIMAGTWSEAGILRFDDCGGMYSGSAHISSFGGVEIKVDSIDNVLAGRRASFIKMDIEGSEYNAIMGCKETINKFKPRLAISIYHKKSDIVELPAIILQLNPDYQFAIRQYCSVGHETVLYAF